MSSVKSFHLDIPDILRYALRLVSSPEFSGVVLANPLLLSAWYQVAGSVVPWPASVKKKITAARGDMQTLSEQFLDLASKLESRFGTKIAGDYVNAFAESFCLSGLYRKEPGEFIDLLVRAEARLPRSVDLGNLQEISRKLKFSEAEARMLELAVYQELSPYFRILLELLMEEPEMARKAWAILLKETQDPQKALGVLKEGKPFSTGLLEFKTITRIPRVCEDDLSLLLDSNTDMLSLLAEPAILSSSTEEAPRVQEEEFTFASQLLKAKDPASLLLWGPKQADKLSVALRLTGKRPAWVLKKRELLKPAHVFLAQACVAEVEEHAILIIPNAADILQKEAQDISFFGLTISEERETKIASMDAELILETPVTCLWLAHSVKRIQESSASAFLFHLECRAGTAVERMKRIEDRLAGLDLSADTKAALAKFHGLSEMQITQALAGANRMPAKLRESFILGAVKASARALDRRTKDIVRKSVTHYSLEFINTAGRMDPEKLLKALKINPAGSLCFFGCPGTGKTQFAEHIASVLEKPLLTRRGSDLLDKYLGETEKHIAKMFADAEDEGAVLFLDEADSFLRARMLSKESWEVTRVNELLQRMEQFSGIFICATNLFQHLDTAALRRFTFKLEFLPLTSRQRVQMFLAEAAVKNPTPEQVEHITEALVVLANLTPGDFATVKRQALLLGETLTTEDWLSRLELETKMKSREESIAE